MLQNKDLNEFISHHNDAVDFVCSRLNEQTPPGFTNENSNYQDDISFSINLLRAALEFDLVQPLVEYLHWLVDVYASRGISNKHLKLLLDLLLEFYIEALPERLNSEVSKILLIAKTSLRNISVSEINAEVDLKMPTAWPECNEFGSALLTGDRRSALAIFEACLQKGKSLTDVELHLVQPALYQVGRDWQANKVSVVQEHLATSTAMTVMAEAFSILEPTKENGKKVLFACVEGNKHDVGLQIVADAFSTHGWDVTFMGADVACKDLIRQVQVINPHLVGLSIALPHQLQLIHNTIAQLHGELGVQCPAVIIGGLAINSYPLISPILNADAVGTDAEDAVKNSNYILES